jgi:hypothetical protein
VAARPQSSPGPSSTGLIEAIGLGIEDFVQPVPEPDRRTLLGVAILALAWQARGSRREASGG